MHRKLAGGRAWQVRLAHEPQVDRPGALAALVDRPHNKRLATADVARSEHALPTRHVVGAGLHVAAGIELQPEVGDGAMLLRANEAHREERQLARPLLLRARHLAELLLPGGLIGVPLDADGLEAAKAALRVALKLLREDAELAAAALLVRRTRPHHHRPERPRGVGRPLAPARILSKVRRLREQFELREALASLAVARAIAVGAGIAAADHDHVLARGRDLTRHVVAGVLLVLLREKLHGIVHALEFAARNRQVAAERGTAGEHDGVIVLGELLRADVGADVHPTAELDSFLPHLLDPSPDPPLLQLEVGDAIHQEPARPVGPLEERDQMAGPIELLRGGEARGPTPHHGHPLASADIGGLWHHPTLVPSLVGDRHLDLLDRDRIFVDAEHAGRLARGGTDAPGELGKVVGGMESLAGLVPLLAVHEVVEVGNDVPQRAAGVAEGHAAVHAAGSLRLHFLWCEDREELVVVLEPVTHRRVAGDLPLILHESAWLTHRSSAPCRGYPGAG